MILCECGEVIKKNTFKEYIQTSINPSTSTIGHNTCGMIFNFIDDNKPKKFSSKTELKSLAVIFAKKNNLRVEYNANFLLEVDRLKSVGKFSDNEILTRALEKLD